MWPAFYGLIKARRPGVLYGEQVDEASAWLDGVCDDLEALGYAIRARVLPAYCAGLDHARERIYFAGYAHSQSESRCSLDAEVARMPGNRSLPRRVGETHGLSPRMAQLRAFGNAIVPHVTAAFLESVMEEAR